MNETERNLVAQLADLVEDLAQTFEIPAAAREARLIARRLREGWGNR